MIRKIERTRYNAIDDEQEKEKVEVFPSSYKFFCKTANMTCKAIYVGSGVGKNEYRGTGCRDKCPLKRS